MSRRLKPPLKPMLSLFFIIISKVIIKPKKINNSDNYFIKLFINFTYFISCCFYIIFIQFINKRNFTAVRKLMTFYTLRPYFMRQGFFLYPLKTTFFKKLWYICQDKHLCDTQFTRFPYTYPYKLFTNSSMLTWLKHSNRFCLC